ncbi:MAG TPA: hypothetical protein VG055_28180 [Planctomycetaceae bacterium]|jgi:hypothetical protein|nr:hypothetical protein [Planctomycetaceae bacterium]
MTSLAYRPRRAGRGVLTLLALFALGNMFSARSVSVGENKVPTGATKKTATGSAAKPPTADASSQGLFRGKVVLVREALARRKIEAREEFDKQVALETESGELIPIVPDWRGRAFFQDEHLRNRPVELVGKRAKGVTYLQVLIIFTFDEKGTRQYTDYYCDTCGFAIYEIKPCECCQGPVRLRYQPRDLPDYIKAGLGKVSAKSARGQ